MSTFEEFEKYLNRRPKNTRSSQNDPTQSERQEFNDSQQAREYNTSGRPFHLSDFCTSKNTGGEAFENLHNPSGRKFDIRELVRSGSQTLQKSDESSYDSDQTLYPSDVIREKPSVQQGPLRSYHEAGREFNMSDRRSRDFIESHIPRISLKLPNDAWYDQRKLSRSENVGERRTPTTWESSNAFDRTFKEQTAIPSRIHSNLYSSQRSKNNFIKFQNLSQEQLVQFLQNGDVGQILTNKTCCGDMKSPLFDTLVMDSYFPGAIEAAVNGQIEFNKVVFDAVFDSGNIPLQLEPENVPMSLLEAFEMRIEYEEQLRENIAGRSHERKKHTTVENKTDEQDEAKTTFWNHRDEVLLASAAEIDLASNINSLAETGLTKAINSLFKAEKMNNFDKHVQLAEGAIRSASPRSQEKNALKSTSTFRVDIKKDEVTSNKSYRPIEIISYIGTTKPASPE